MALNYRKEGRLFEELKNNNERLYRESETHARVFIANEALREDFGFEKKIYEEVHDPEKTL